MPSLDRDPRRDRVTLALVSMAFGLPTAASGAASLDLSADQQHRLAAGVADGETIDVDVLSLDEHEPKKLASAAPAVPIGLTLADVEQEHILRTLRAVEGSRSRAALKATVRAGVSVSR